MCDTNFRNLQRRLIVGECCSRSAISAASASRQSKFCHRMSKNRHPGVDCNIGRCPGQFCFPAPADCCLGAHSLHWFWQTHPKNITQVIIYNGYLFIKKLTVFCNPSSWSVFDRRWMCLNICRRRRLNGYLEIIENVSVAYFLSGSPGSSPDQWGLNKDIGPGWSIMSGISWPTQTVASFQDWTKTAPMRVGEMCLSCLLLIRNDRVNKSITNFSQEYGNSVRAPLRNRFSDLIICPLLRMVNFIQTEVGIISIGRKKQILRLKGKCWKVFFMTPVTVT